MMLYFDGGPYDGEELETSIWDSEMVWLYPLPTVMIHFPEGPTEFGPIPLKEAAAIGYGSPDFQLPICHYRAEVLRPEHFQYVGLWKGEK